MRYVQGIPSEFMDEISRHRTVFTSPWGLCESLLNPFGVLNSALAFQCFMNNCLVGLRDLICISFLDDVLCHGKKSQNGSKDT